MMMRVWCDAASRALRAGDLGRTQARERREKKKKE
jgi:hypothetical protein